MAETELGRTLAALAAAPEDEAARLAAYGALADAMLWLLLEEEAEGDVITPCLEEVKGVPHVLAFADEERMVAHKGGIAPHAALPGRALAGLLAGQGIGILLDPGQETAVTISPNALEWLTDLLSRGSDAGTGRPLEVLPPGAIPAGLAAVLERAAGRLSGAVRGGWLVRMRWEDGRVGRVLVLADARPEAEAALAGAVAEALAFSGQSEALDVAFAAGGSALAERVARVGVWIAVPEPERPAGPAAPGSDPGRPPRLR